MEEAKPIVLTKPVRGREMLSKKGPLGKVAPAGAVEEKVDKKRDETYYEGYVDGQLFLVPDSNLEAMKDMINFKMRAKTSIRYKHQTSYDIQYYDQFTEKLNELLEKLDDFQESGDFERIKEESTDESTDERSSSEDTAVEKPTEEKTESIQEKVEDNKKSEETVESKESEKSKETLLSIGSEKSKESEKRKESMSSNVLQSKVSARSKASLKSHIEIIKSEIMEHLEKAYVQEDVSLSSSSSSKVSKLSTNLEEPQEEMPNTVPEEPDIESKNDELRVRFLISGHFKDGENPIYIVQEYDGKNDIFKDQKLDFSSTQEASKANIFVSGKLYTENILVGSAGNPMYLNTNPEKIVINKEKSKMYDSSFEHIFVKEDYRIHLNGNFIKGKNLITPSLSLFIKERSTSFSSEDNMNRVNKQDKLNTQI